MAVISSQPNNTKQNLFVKSKYSSFSFVLALFFSILLMVADAYYHYLNGLRSGFTLMVSPLQYVVDYPVRISGWIQLLISTKQALIKENMRLRYEHTILEAQLQKLLVIQNENSELKQLLSASSNEKIRTMAAEILAVDTGMARQLIVLNKGKRDGVFIGQAVLDAKGVMGQIIDVGSLTSTVLLISDAKSAVPVQNNRTGERAILTGMNHLSYLSLINLPKTSKIAKGDVLVTSGLGRRYPEGYPVGRVEQITNTPGEDFIKVQVSPIAALNRNRLVLLIWPETNHATLSSEIFERLNVFEKIEAIKPPLNAVAKKSLV